MVADDNSRTPPMGEWVDSWCRSMRAENLSPLTIKAYSVGFRQFAEYLAEHGITDPFAVRRRHVEGWLEHLASLGRQAATRENRYLGVHAFYRWLQTEEDGVTDPTATMRRPKVVPKPVPIITPAEMEALFATTVGRSFQNRRDRAMFSILADSGLRASELIGLTVDDVDFGFNVTHVLGKGRRLRSAPFGAATARDLDRYLRVRAGHAFADTGMLWLGKQGPLTVAGLRDALWRRCAQAKIRRLHPHAFRHTFAHSWLEAGGSEGDLMVIAGWSERSMLDRYGASTAAVRAQASYRGGRSPVDALGLGGRQRRDGRGGSGRPGQG